MVHSLGT